MKKLLLIIFVLVQFICRAEYDSTYVLSITQKYAIPENVVNGDYVGIWKKTYTWSPVGTISYTIEQNYNNAFSINSSTGLITVSNAGQINGQVTQQDMLINLIIRTTDSNGGSPVIELDTARIWVKEDAYCKFIDYDYNDTGTGTRTAPYNDFSDVVATVSAGYGYFIKRGNTPADKVYNISGFQASALHPTIIGAYSSGNNPIFNGSGLSSGETFEFHNTPIPSSYCYIFNIDIKNYPTVALRIATRSDHFAVYNSYYEGNCRVTWDGQADVYFYGSAADSLTNWGHELINLESYHCLSAILKTDASGVYAYNIKAAVNNTTEGYNFRFAISQYSKLSHFIFTNGTRSLQSRSPGVVISDGIITGASEAGVFLVTNATYGDKPNDLKIHNVLFMDNSYGIYSYNSNINGTIIEDCRFESNTNDGIYFYNGGFNRIIQRCSFINNGSDGIHLNRSSQTSTNLNINYNEFYGNTGYGINASGAICANGLKVYNNTVDGNITLSGTSGSVVRNNFFKALVEGSTPTKSNNLDIDDIATGNYFTDYAGHDYSLKSTANLAIDNGLDLDLTLDIKGTTVGNSPDIGAYEYVSGGSTPTVTITATDASASETGPDSGIFTVSRGAVTSGNLTVNYAKSGSTTSADYTQSLSGNVTIADGNSAATITITPVDDSEAEGNQTVILTLNSGTGYAVAASPNNTATVTIADNDGGYVVPIAHWMFEQNGTDASGNGHTATLTGTPTFLTGAVGTYGVNLNASDRYADCGTFNLGNAFSVTGWYKFTGTTRRTLIANTTYYTPNGFFIYMDGTTGKLTMVTGNGSLTATASSTTGNHTDNAWKHFAVVVDKTAGTCNFYINGVSKTSASTIRTDFTTNATVILGKTTDNNYKLYGHLDDARIYDYKLSGSDISEIYNQLKNAKIPINEEMSNTDVSIYPIPFGEVLTIENISSIKQVEMLNVSGQTSLTKNNEAAQIMKINTENLKSGVYFLRLVDGSGEVSTYKVVK